MLELKAQQELDELKNKYDIDFLKKIENDDKKLACLYNYVFPSLASRVRLANEKKAKYKFKCSFEECLAKNITISGKQGFLRHTISKHGHLIPGSGRFLMPKSVYFNHVSFKCNNCNMLFDSLITINSHNQQGLCRPQIASASNSTLNSQSADESTTITKTTALALESPTKTLAIMWHNEWHLAEENITDETFDHLLQRLNNISDVTTARTNQQSGIISNMSKRELSSYSLSGNIQKRPREDKTSTSSSASSDEELDFDNNYSDTDNYDCMRDDDSSLHSLEERLQEMKKDA